jgi:tRNA-Thr(GGU) m(6)t(6)A37 methyltransferase TsaA
MVKKMEQITENIIAYIHTDYNEKFGIPRQSGLAPSVQGRIVFEPEFRDPEAVRGLEGFSHIWLIWEFSENRGKAWSPMVRPPRLGGNRRMGVFATRSPFRPNPIGLSCVELSEVRLDDPEGPVIVVQGPDLLDGTPILDIKPYIPYADSFPDASIGFLSDATELQVHVVIPDNIREILGERLTKEVSDVLQNDPRPTYQKDSDRVYGVLFGGYNITFTVQEDVLTVIDAEKQLT